MATNCKVEVRIVTVPPGKAAFAIQVVCRTCDRTVKLLVGLDHDLEPILVAVQEHMQAVAGVPIPETRTFRTPPERTYTYEEMKARFG